MNRQDTRLRQQNLVDNYVCLECCQEGHIQKLVLRVEGACCPVDPTHSGHIREQTALARRRREQADAREVIHNYPELDPNPLRETVQESIDALFP